MALIRKQPPVHCRTLYSAHMLLGKKRMDSEKAELTGTKGEAGRRRKAEDEKKNN